MHTRRCALARGVFNQKVCVCDALLPIGEYKLNPSGGMKATPVLGVPDQA